MRCAEFIQPNLLSVQIPRGSLQAGSLGTLALWEPPLRVWGGGIAKGRSFPQPNLDMVPCAPDHPKVKERALDSGLLLRQIRCSDSSNMAPEGKARGQARGNVSGALGSLLGPRLWPKSLAVKGVKVATEEPTSSGKMGQLVECRVSLSHAGDLESSLHSIPVQNSEHSLAGRAGEPGRFQRRGRGY